MSTSSSSSPRRKKVYTKYGDQGETSLLYGGRVSKASPHTEAYGITDEAVSLMGLARALTDDDKVKNILRDLQRELFTVAAELATDPSKYDLFHQHFTAGYRGDGGQAGGDNRRAGNPLPDAPSIYSPRWNSVVIRHGFGPNRHTHRRTQGGKPLRGRRIDQQPDPGPI